MNAKNSNGTALMAAAARAAHLVVDRPPLIFSDPLAKLLLGSEAGELLGYHRLHGDRPVLAAARAQTICRSRYAEDRALRAFDSGMRQCVVLGAGLDTFAHRSGSTEHVRFFEVDRPDAQRTKRERLAAAGIPVPGRVTYVPLDFERDSLAEGLHAHGFDGAEPSVVLWLGVSMYLGADAVAGTLAATGSFAVGTELVMDYLLPAEMRDAAAQQYVDAVALFAAEQGEPWQTFFTPGGLAALLSDCGFDVVESVRQHEMLDATLWDRQDALAPIDLSRVVHARVRGQRSEYHAGPCPARKGWTP
ncbi:class I SAM-dependent methyltransferase [Streptomyces sp. NPDC101194]|uniref:class I SAM-dependent methyltransferase n=1 Tax=Streptomyces sp. NPDC101194 TaxID=3366127 RepID=UPI00380D3B1C